MPSISGCNGTVGVKSNRVDESNGGTTHCASPSSYNKSQSHSNSILATVVVVKEVTVEITMEAGEEALIYPTLDTLHRLTEVLPRVQTKAGDVDDDSA